MDIDKSMVSYTEGIIDYVPECQFEEVAKAIDCFHKYKTEFVWNIMSLFEGIPVTLPNTQQILDGFAVEGVKIYDLLRIKNYGNALDSVCSWIRDNSFTADRYSLCEIHGICSLNDLDIVDRAVFRRENVKFDNVEWKPPSFSDLNFHWKEIQYKINDHECHPYERAFAIFAGLSRTQFFMDVNKRTAMLFANALLIEEGYPFFMIPSSMHNEFGKELNYFYTTGNADNLFKFLADNCIPEVIMEICNEPRR